MPLKPIVLIPVFNERDHIGPLLDRVPQEFGNVLVIDDASTDGTSEEIRARNALFIRHAARQGVGACLQDGIRHARAHGFDAVVVMAGNGKDDPQQIPHLMAALEGGADYVQGSRYLKGGEWKNIPLGRLVAIKLFTWLWQICLWKRLSDVTNGFRAYRMSFLERPEVQWDQEWLGTYEFEYYLQYQALQGGVKFQEVPVTKNYPSRRSYTKIRPGRDWIRIVKPLFLLMAGIRH